MSKIQAVVFDLYGTLIDIRTDEGRKEVWEKLSLYLRYFGATTSAAGLRSDYEREKERYLQESHERYPEVDLQTVFTRILKREGLGSPLLALSFGKLYRLLTIERLQPFPDTVPVLREAERSAYLLAVVSNAQRLFCSDEIRLLGLERFFPHVVLSTDYGFLKPDPRLFSIALTLLGVAPGEAVYIGDSPENDVSGPKQAGMRAVLLNRDREKLNPAASPDFVAADLEQAWQWVRQAGSTL